MLEKIRARVYGYDYDDLYDDDDDMFSEIFGLFDRK